MPPLDEPVIAKDEEQEKVPTVPDTAKTIVPAELHVLKAVEQL
jgi:hypothetical protein